MKKIAFLFPLIILTFSCSNESGNTGGEQTDNAAPSKTHCLDKSDCSPQEECINNVCVAKEVEGDDDDSPFGNDDDYFDSGYPDAADADDNPLDADEDEEDAAEEDIKDAGSKKECIEDADCPPKEFCDIQAGKCLLGSGGDCFHNEDCPKGEVCKKFRCEASEQPIGDDDDTTDDDAGASDLGDGAQTQDTGTGDASPPEDSGNSDDDGGGEEDASTCVPSCVGKECGDDGCGGACGVCSENAFCSSGTCKCLYSENKCGDVCCSLDKECANEICCPIKNKCAVEDEGRCDTAPDKHRFQTCAKTAGCLVWSDWIECDTANGETCKNGVCGKNACTFGERKCKDNSVLECAVLESGFTGWQVTQTCGTGYCQEGYCKGCINDSDCAAPTPRCETVKGLCVQCLANSQCEAPNSLCDPNGNRCVKCITSADCSNGYVCDRMANDCVCPNAVCGGICCEANSTCYPANTCCVINCAGKVCGSNGCGGTCGTCPTNEVCSADQKSCQCPNVVCNGVCCPQTGSVCHNNQCCKPDCAGKTCGPDGCGGSCGNCNNRMCVNGKCICPLNGWVYSANNHCYWKKDMGYKPTWTQANEMCQSEGGGYIVTYTSQAEQDAVTQQLGMTKTCHWVGCHDPNKTRVFEWITGEPFSWTRWCSGEPNNWDGNEYYCVFKGCYKSDCWDDTRHTGSNDFIDVVVCEAH